MLDARNPRIRSGPPRPSRIALPRTFTLPSGTERYAVAGGGAAVVSLRIGDRLTIENTEGGQHAVLVAASGTTSIGDVLGVPATDAPAGLRSLLARGDASLRGVRRHLERGGVDLARARALRLFGAETRAGAQESFTAVADASVVVAAPTPRDDGVMDFAAQDTATPLAVRVDRARVDPRAHFALPEPLADPTSDLRIGSATAEAYMVKAGDYIQILDVDGRQCTDFQCFDARKLDRGLELPLDVTTTRSVQGHAYPLPGLHGKYFDHDMTPLVEVVQDTCGRHDAFSLACYPKYYDDIGYPGHVNCTENFNAALAPHGVAGRRGWMAINFFYNTGIDAHGVIYIDEPWSRPGDYVLLRALTDIVCVSSACPDDTTAANGWQPTDIHVRTYDGAEPFRRASASRSTPDAEPKMTKETGFHPRFAELTRDFVDYNGYWLANSFSGEGTIAEYRACREAAAMIDLSALRKFEITGPDAEALCQYVLTRNVKTLPEGGVVYSAMCYPHGGMVDDGTLFRLGRDNFRWIGGSDYGGQWFREQAEALGLKVLVRSSTDMQHNVAVQGPRSREILDRVIWTAPHQPRLTELDWFRFTPARIGDAEGTPVVVSRTGYTGELGYEVFCHPRHAPEVFDAIWAVGEGDGLKPMGLAALNMLRIESGLIFAGYDFSDQTDPFEAGIGFTVPLKSKEDDFIGREALIRRKEHPARAFVGLVIDAGTEIGHGDPIHVGRAQVGEVTSATRSPLLGQNIALARVDVAYRAPGTEVEIGKLDGHQKRLAAKVVALSHYDPKKERPRA